jgi:hypothetical protein
MNNKHVEFEQHFRAWLIAQRWSAARSGRDLSRCGGLWGWLGKLSQELLAEHLKDAKG